MIMPMSAHLSALAAACLVSYGVPVRYTRIGRVLRNAGPSAARNPPLASGARSRFGYRNARRREIADSRVHVVSTAAAWCSLFWRSRRWPVVA